MEYTSMVTTVNPNKALGLFAAWRNFYASPSLFPSYPHYIHSPILRQAQHHLALNTSPLQGALSDFKDRFNLNLGRW